MSNNGSDGEKPKSPSKPADAPPEPLPQEIFPTALESALRSFGIDPNDPKVSKALGISLTMMFSGALPWAPPPILKEYGNIRPDLIDKLIKLTEEQSAHRCDMELRRTVGSETRLNRSQWIGAVVAGGGLVLSAIAAYYNTAAAIVIAVVGVGDPTAAIWLAHNMHKPSTPKPPAQVS